MKKLVSILLVLTMVMMACVGLAETVPDPEAVGESLAAKGTKTAEDTVEVGFLLSMSSHQTFIDMIRHARMLEESLNCKIIENYFDSDVNKLVEGIENFTADGVDVIIFQNNDPEATRDAVERANAAGIITIAWDIDMDIADLCYMGVGYDIGYAIGKNCADYVNEKWGGKAKIGVFKMDTVSWAKERGEGMMAALTELLPEAEIVGEVYGATTTEGYDDAMNLLSLDPEINCLVALFDNPLIGAYNAFISEGRGQTADDPIAFFGCDCTQEGMQIMTNGEENVWFASIFMDLNTLTKTMVTNGVNARRGILPESRKGYFGLNPVNKENYQDWPQIYE